MSSKPMVGQRGIPEIDFRNVRSVMETPILDDRKWAKLPDIDADAFVIDLEDSVVPAEKERARERAVDYLGRRDFFGQRLVVARPNNLGTPWGREDIAAMAEVNVRLMLYPKARSADELAQVREILDGHGAAPLLFPIIETAGALFDVRAISQLPGIGGLFVGIGDLSVDAGVPFYGGDGEIHSALAHARDQVAFAAAAAGIASTDTVYARDLRDAESVRAAIADARQRGFTSLVTFYPPHVEQINALLRPSSEEVREAREVIAMYSEAQAAGRPALVLSTGRTLLLLDYVRAARVLERAEAVVPTRGEAA